MSDSSRSISNTFKAIARKIFSTDTFFLKYQNTVATNQNFVYKKAIYGRSKGEYGG